MKSLAEYAQTVEVEQVQQADRKKVGPHPTGWEPGVTWDGKNGTLISKPVEDPNPQYDDLLRQWGFDPTKYEIVEPLQLRTWEAAIGDGQTKQMWYYKAGIRLRESAPGVPSYQDLVDEMKKYKPTARRVPNGELAFVVNIADLQTGKADGDGVAGTVGRFLDAFESVAARYKELRRVGRKLGSLYVVGMGDLIEGCSGNYSQQTFTVELNHRDQVKVTRRLVRDAIKRWAPDFEKVVVAAVPGNHGEIRQGNRSYTDDADNYDVALFEQVAEVLAENAAFEHVKFYLPYDEMTIVLDVAGVPIAFTHAHKAERSAGTGLPQAKVKTWWKDQAFGERPAGDARVLVSAHYHHFSHIDFGPKVHLQCPALDGGSKWWEDATGSASAKGILTFVAGDGGIRDVQVV